MVAKVAGVLLVLAGVLALVFGGFSYTKDKRDLKLGPIELSVKQDERVQLPPWLGVGAIGLGVVLLLVGGRRK